MMLNDIKVNDSSALLSPQKNKTLQVIYICHEFFKAIGLQFSFSIIYIYIYILSFFKYSSSKKLLIQAYKSSKIYQR
jgi:hypothetical protein